MFVLYRIVQIFNIIEGDTRPIIVDPSGKASRYTLGVTLNDIRDEYLLLFPSLF